MLLTGLSYSIFPLILSCSYVTTVLLVAAENGPLYLVLFAPSIYNKNNFIKFTRMHCKGKEKLKVD